MSTRTTSPPGNINMAGPPIVHRANLSVFFRDQLALSTWLLLGASAQACLTLLPVSKVYAVAPVLVLAVYQLAHFARSVSAYRPGSDGSIMHKFSASFEDDEKSQGSVTVLLLKARLAHPLGLLSHGAKDLGEFTEKLNRSLEANPDDYDFLGGTSALGSSERESRNELILIYYFRTMSGLQKFAHSPLHSEAWAWWYKNEEKLGAIGISHEVFEAPAGSWEAIYSHYPLQGIMQTTFAVEGKDGAKEYRTPFTDARKEKHRTSLGRMGKSQGEENGEDGSNPFAYQA